ncbi:MULTISPECIES: trehalose-phosphatase [Mycobacterium]|uniref:Trehalose 6-phosphate phosphatase n=2 Tax=Mycobacterium avium complex (MAC) TaxID=120793 RepID=A0ABN6AM28_9MYCO|nr:MULTISPECIES: trehalose-phosphatase [Mycobacterium]AFC55841.1 otsB2 [Mycobacterium paraintracellulare]AFS16259.1 Trehalose-phosphate phosphatase [Mycobacterium intracellulare subsp. intracellulare MTCC 9506]OCB26562.1 trehalose-phosphatase [Mycobacterium intracellulare subsp. yongonense]OSC20824.1 trehalose-phosphatase [Mycobacterium paraintracellulare]PBA57169.1 trehalose-phosphatase [Mycobacterium intracellulare subsp. chimaera]
MPVIIDPRRHDAVLFDLETDLGSTLAARLRDVGVGTAVVPADGPARAAADLKVRPGRAVVVAGAAAGVEAARAAGFASVIGVGPAKSAGALRDAGADAVVSDLGEVGVRTGDLRMSQLPDAMRALTDAADGLAGRRPAVFFDFDGTLSDIVDDPDAARPVAGATEALAKLADGCPVAVLSGRDLADVTNRVGVPGIWYAGSHGFELTAPDGTHHQNDAAAAAIPVLEQAAARLRDQLGGIPGVVVEHKRFGVAVHYRNAERDRVGEVLAAVRAAGRRDALRVTTGREVIELRPDLDWDKGKTLRWVIDHLHRAGSGSLTPVYLGDDITDEDAFDAVHDDGVPILVRHSDDGDRATAALFALDSPARAAAFTDRLADQLEA